MSSLYRLSVLDPMRENAVGVCSGKAAFLCYLDATAIIRRPREKLKKSADRAPLHMYSVSLKQLKLNRWTAAVHQLNVDSGHRHEMSVFAFSASNGGICWQQADPLPAHFCVDEGAGDARPPTLYLVKLNAETGVLTVGVQVLTVVYKRRGLYGFYDDMQYCVSKLADDHAAVLRHTPFRHCSHLAIRPPADKRTTQCTFIVTLSTCPDLCIGGRHQHVQYTLSDIDVRLKTVRVRLFDANTVPLPIYKLLSTAAQEDDSDEKSAELVNVLGEISAFPPLSGIPSSLSSLLRPQMRIRVYQDDQTATFVSFIAERQRFIRMENAVVGRWGHYLLLVCSSAEDDSCWSEYLCAVRLLIGADEARQFSLALCNAVREKQATVLPYVPFCFLPLDDVRLGAGVEWTTEADRRFYLSKSTWQPSTGGAQVLQSLSFLLEGRSRQLLADCRQCAGCGERETSKWIDVRQGKSISSFKVCKMCKQKGRDKLWWQFPCHFCSVDCFRRAWATHKKEH